MARVSNGERDAAAYPGLIQQYRSANPGTTFRIVEQLDAGVRLVTRLEARRVDEASRAALVSRGINVSRFDAQGRLAEEWAIWSTWLRMFFGRVLRRRCSSGSTSAALNWSPFTLGRTRTRGYSATPTGKSWNWSGREETNHP